MDRCHSQLSSTLLLCGPFGLSALVCKLFKYFYVRHFTIQYDYYVLDASAAT